MPGPTQGQFEYTIKVRDLATGRFTEANNKIIAGARKAGVAVNQSGKLMAKSYQKASAEAKRHGRMTNRSLSKIESQIGRMRNILLLYFFAWRPIKRILTAVTGAANKQQFAERKLEAAFAGSGRATKEQVQNLKELAASLQKTTMFGDEAIINAQAQLATFKMNADQVAQLTPRMLDMATAITNLTGKQVDLQAISIALGKGFTGNAGILARYGVVIDKQLLKHAQFSDLIAELDKNYQGLAEAMRTTYRGQVAMLTNAMGDYREQVGFVIIESTVLIATMDILKETFEKNTEALKLGREATDNYSSAWLTAAAIAIGVASSFKVLWRSILEGGRIIVLYYTKILEFGLRLAELSQKPGWKAIFEIMMPGKMKFFADVFKPMEKFEDKMKEVNNLVEEFNKLLIDDIVKGAESISDAITTEMVGAYEILINKMYELGKINSEIKDRLKNDIKDLADATGKQFNFMADLSEGTVKSMESSMGTFFLDTLKGDLKTAKDYFKALMDSILKNFADTLAKMLVQEKTWQAISKMFGLSGFGASASKGLQSIGAAGPSAVPVKHTGGFISASSRRFHPGGIAGDEVPAILQSGEGVLSRRGMSALSALNRGEQPAAGGDTFVIINAIDTASFRDRLNQNHDVMESATAGAVLRNKRLRKLLMELA